MLKLKILGPDGYVEPESIPFTLEVAVCHPYETISDLKCRIGIFLNIHSSIMRLLRYNIYCANILSVDYPIPKYANDYNLDEPGELNIILSSLTPMHTMRRRRDIANLQGRTFKRPSEKCMICHKNEIDMAFVPCGHEVVCRKCVRTIAFWEGNEHFCPFCSKKVNSSCSAIPLD